MHSVLFIAAFPDRGTGIPGHNEREWDKYLTAITPKLTQDSGVVRLSENIWLIDIAKSIVSLAHLIATSDHEKVAYNLLSFEHAPQWLLGGLDPNTTRVRNATT
jgi:hypothetical protein